MLFLILHLIKKFLVVLWLAAFWPGLLYNGYCFSPVVPSNFVVPQSC